jgi:YidC/Oxa1 family membrane protein insertase
VIAVAWIQAILNGLGAVLAFIYKLIPNYGVAIILLTVGIRVLLLPLGVKQIRSMQATQAIQPKIKAIQAKYKGRPEGRQKQYEETQKLYREYGINPAAGCLPLLLQFPVLIALFAVLRMPAGLAHIPHNDQNPQLNSKLYTAIVKQDTNFLGASLLCSAAEAGKQVDQTKDRHGKTLNPLPKIQSLNCGKGGATRIPYYLFAIAMVGTTYYQQRQMQRASPAGVNPQQQALTRVMPLLFGVWGFLFPAGLVVYWTTTNAIQIGQQHFMLPKAPVAEGPPPAKGSGRANGGSSKAPEPRPTRPRSGAGGGGTSRRTPSGGQRRPGGPAKPRGSGGNDGGDRKKRRKR